MNIISEAFDVRANALLCPPPDPPLQVCDALLLLYRTILYIPGHKRRQKKFVRSFKPVPSKAKFCIRKLITIN